MNKPWYLVAWLLAIELVIVLLFIPGDFTDKAIKQESLLVEKHLGVETRKWVKRKADAWYESSMIDSGFYVGMHRVFIPTQAEREKSIGMEGFGGWWFDYMDGRIKAFSKVVSQFYLRIAQFALWMPYMLILLLPSLFDGLMTWRIKRTNYDYASPIIHRYSSRIIVIIIFGAIILSFVPIAVSPMVMPILMMLWSVSAGLMVGNFQKRV